MCGSAIGMNDIVSLCKRRGFIFQSSEIYGGMNGFWDYGPLGVALKNNIRDIWWRSLVECSPLDKNGDPIKIFGLDSSIIQHPTTWKASGHVDNFSDPMVDCRITKMRYRSDQLIVYKSQIAKDVSFAFFEDESQHNIAAKIKKISKDDISNYKVMPLQDVDPSDYAKIIAPNAQEPGSLTEPKAFNLMFETRVGAVVNDSNAAYLRPETAQGIFLNYKNIIDSASPKMPFGIAQIGKAFRNEVTPRNFIFRSREFEQMELEWFCHPDDAQYWKNYWLEYRYNWWMQLGLSKSKIRIRNHDQDELSHYAKLGYGTSDIEYQFPFSGNGFSELEGIAHRCDFDLSQHQAFSGVKQEYVDQINNLKYIPHVIEPSAGLTRAVLAVLCNAYTVDSNRPSGMYMNFNPKTAPVKVAVMPLQAKGEVETIAKNIFLNLRQHFIATYEDKQSIGKRYAKNDEIGTPYCVTVDFESIDTKDVTIRNRNTTHQERVPIDSLNDYLQKAINYYDN